MPLYEIRTMTQQDVATAIDWAADEGWNPGLHDATCFYAADSTGFLIGLLAGEPIATISVVRYGSAFGFLGLYIVKPVYRGKRYGLKLWNEGLAYLGERTIGLDGVVAQQANYRLSGFELAYRNIRYQGTAPAHGGKDSPSVPQGRPQEHEDPTGDGGQANEVSLGAHIVPLSSLAFDEVNAYDRSLFPADRSTFLRCWIAQPQSTALGIVRAGKLSGYGVMRACRSGHKIGPLFADDADLADALFNRLAASVPRNARLYLDTPETNPAAVALAKRHGMTVIFETARMYKGPAPELPVERIFGITTFELG